MNIKQTVLALALGAVSASSFADAPQPGRQVQSFLNALNSSGGKPIEQLSPQAERDVLISTQKGATLPDADVTEKTIAVGSQPLKLNIVKPKGTQGTLPVFMFFHSGGWVLGDFQTHERLVRDLVVASGAAAVFVNYTPSPEAHYPG
nr:amylovoran biosynthesis protein AmsF [Candidatus Pantoea persica]